MFNNIVLGQYVHGTSWIYKIDPRMKIIFTFLFVLTIFFANSIETYGLVAGFVLLYLISTRLPLKRFLKALKPLLIIFTITSTLILITTKTGDLLIEWKFIKIYEDGIKTAMFLLIRLISIVLISSILTFSTTPAKISLGLETLMKPLKIVKIPTEALAMIITLTLRLIPMIFEETMKIIKAQTSRGAEFESKNIFKKIKYLVSLLIPLFIMAFKRGADLSNAMIARGYSTDIKRTKLYKLHFKVYDYIYFLGAILILFVVINVRYEWIQFV